MIEISENKIRLLRRFIGHRYPKIGLIFINHKGKHKALERFSKVELINLLREIKYPQKELKNYDEEKLKIIVNKTFPHLTELFVLM